jgi:imidazolonepropionase-like amidohydrolase
MATTIIKNAEVFDGEKWIGLKTVGIKDGLIADIKEGVRVIDGTGCTLMPGLIDSHVHLHGKESLQNAIKWGITTMLDMASYPPESVDSIRELPGLTHIKSCYSCASGSGSIQVTRMGQPESSVVANADQAEGFVNLQLSCGAEYIKIIVEDPQRMGNSALKPEAVQAITENAHKKGKMVYAHVTSPVSYQIALDAGVDVLNHIPLEAPLSKALIDQMVHQKTIVIPTMIMMQRYDVLTKKTQPELPSDFNHVRNSVGALKKAGITVIAGTDANLSPNPIISVPHGEGLHQELECLVAAGLSPEEAIASATGLPALYLELEDRGRIEWGRRADLLLVKGNPLQNIKDTRNIKSIWIDGHEIE